MPDTTLMIAAFTAVSSLIVLGYLLLSPRKDNMAERMEALRGDGGGGGMVAMGGGSPALRSTSLLERWTTREIKREEHKNDIRARLIQAGLYKPSAAALFFTLRGVLLATPVLLGWMADGMGLGPPGRGILFGALAGIAGTLAPSFWLDHVKRARQTKIRRALPDALDVLAVCMEGGLSVNAAFSRVARELATAHRLLAVEFHIVERQTRMGKSTGEAVRELALRFDLEELRSLATVIIQAERIGSSVVSALEVFSESMRERRHQRAEEMAQKAGTKLLFPTLLCIFPGIFIVILGPAAIQIYKVILQGVVKGY